MSSKGIGTTDFRKLLARPVSSTEFEDLLKVRKDPFYFSTFINVIHPIKGKVPFHLYPYQVKVLHDFLQHRFNIVLKFRQAGLTELIAMFCLWYAMYHRNKNINIISIKDTVAKKVLRKIKFMYRNLPDHLKIPVVNGTRSKDIGTASEMEFSTGSIISSIPTTEEAGRSEALSLLVIDEAAIVRWANTIWAAAFPTLSTGGRAILNSTPYGMGNFFHKTWTDATLRNNPFNPIRLTWQMHPERDMSWYAKMSEALGPRRTAQEIDGDFLSSGFPVFDLVRIRAIEDMMTDYKPLDVQHDKMWRSVFRNLKGNVRDNLIIYDEPKPDRYYTIGSDVSTGRSRDFSAFTIMDNYGEEAGCFKGKLPPSDLSNLLIKLGHKFNGATLAPEANDVGLAVAEDIQDDNYPNLYYATKMVRKKGKKKPQSLDIPGWYTTTANRQPIITELEEDIRLDNIIIKDPYFVQESYTFIYDERNRAVALNKGKGENSGEEDFDEDGGFTDDAILGKAITNRVRKKIRKVSATLPI